MTFCHFYSSYVLDFYDIWSYYIYRKTKFKSGFLIIYYLAKEYESHDKNQTNMCAVIVSSLSVIYGILDGNLRIRCNHQQVTLFVQ
jgi:hypothetical protein